MLAFTYEEIENQKRADPDLQQLYIGPVFTGTPPLAEELAIFRDSLATATVRRVFDWWLSLSDGSNPPFKSQLTVRAMAPFIASVALLDCDLDDNARVRLAGADVEDMIGHPISGCKVCDLYQWSPALRRVFQQTIYGRNCVRYSVRDLRKVGREYKTVGVLELPIIDESTGKPLDFVHFESLNLPSPM